MKSESGWIEEFRRGYDTWWPTARPFIERHEFSEAFRTYPWPTFTTSPWAPLAGPLADCRIAVVTTGGLYVRDADLPFDTTAPDGDVSYRALPADAAATELGIAHSHFPHESAEADLNIIYPLDRLRTLQAAGTIGGLARTHYSLMGYAPRAADLAETTGPAIAAALKHEGVDAVLVVPV